MHKKFIDDKFELKVIYNSETTILEILELIIKEKRINSFKFMKFKGNKKYIYLCVPDEDNTKIVTTLGMENEVEQTYESKTESLNYNIDYSKTEKNNYDYDYNEEK